jgi:hypothetical protein
MNLGLGNLTELKGQLLAASLRADTNYDAVITGIGTGVAGQFDQHCNRQWQRVEGEQDVFSADRRHWYLSRFPVEGISLCEKQDSVEDGWVALPGLIQAQQLEQGYVMFIAVQGYYWSRLRITYTGGYWFDTTEDGSGVMPGTAAALPAEVKLAWYLQCQNVWKRWEKLGAGITERPELSGAVGQLALAGAVKELLRPFKRMQMT